MLQTDMGLAVYNESPMSVCWITDVGLPDRLCDLRLDRGEIEVLNLEVEHFSIYF